MTILITADIHWSENSRDQYRFDLVEKLHKLIKERKVHHLLILGDLTENKEKFSAAFVNKIADIFYGLSQLCMVTFLKGNHDFIGNADEPFFEFIKYIRNVDYIKVPTIKPIGLFIPFTNDWKKDWNNGKMLKGHRIVFAHQTLQGAAFGFGGIAEEGVPLDAIPDDCSVISGDIHKRQTIGRVTYVGAPYLIDYGDDYKPRVILLEDDGKQVSISIKGRQKRLIEIPQTYSGSLADGIAYNQYVGKGDIVKFRVNLEDASKFNEFKQRIYEWGQKSGVTIDGIQGIKTVELTRKKQTNKMSVFKRPDKELVQDHAKREQLDERTLNIGLELTDE
jgi:DNA repair exonuclease SbcCD nuclease subunit